MAIAGFLLSKQWRSTTSRRLQPLSQVHVITVSDRYTHTYCAPDPAMCTALARQTVGLHAQFADQAI